MNYREAYGIYACNGILFNHEGLDRATGKVLVQIDPRYFRPTEVDFLLGDPAKAKAKLGWRPEVTFPELVRMMVTEDVLTAERMVCKEHGFRVHNGQD